MDHGYFEVITGTMFSGKTDELLRRLRRVAIAGQKFIVFKPELDTRSGKNLIKSNNGDKLTAHEIPYQKPAEMISVLHHEEKLEGLKIDVIAIDEAQFFTATSEMTLVVNYLTRHDYRLIAAGLDTDFRGEPFGAMPKLIALADEVTKLSAVCKVCGSFRARYPQRFIDGKPAPYDSPQILVGGQEAYEARCRKCFILPGQPTLQHF